MIEVDGLNDQAVVKVEEENVDDDELLQDEEFRKQVEALKLKNLTENNTKANKKKKLLLKSKKRVKMRRCLRELPKLAGVDGDAADERVRARAQRIRVLCNTNQKTIPKIL